MRYISAHRKNYGNLRPLSVIKYIVVHYTANKGDTAEGNAKYFANNAVKASAHYFVDENEVVQSIKDECTAYSVGGNKYTNTKGGSFYGKCTNTNSISVELCDSYNAVPEKTAERAAELIRSLMDKYGITADRVIRHYDVTGKLCPKPFTDNAEWNSFKLRLEDKEMNERIEKLEKRVAELEEKAAVYDYIDENMPEWIRNITEWALSKGIISGTGSGLGMTRTKAETLVMLKNVLEM
ncbi:MAG: N-acetylmuramoyl-L-alanine amidase [Clostridia bacterium]|nr:N-acetylmuramoyl-L-alanine amidase [Clostridia bacterium]